jgi:hypothetical protein
MPPVWPITTTVVKLLAVYLILLRYVFKGYGLWHHSTDTARSRWPASAGFHAALAAASRALFEDLRFCSRRRNRCARITIVTWWCQPVQLRPSK